MGTFPTLRTINAPYERGHPRQNLRPVRHSPGRGAGPCKAGAQKETGHTLAVVPGYLPTAPPVRLSCLSYGFRPSAVARLTASPVDPGSLNNLIVSHCGTVAVLASTDLSPAGSLTP